MRNSGKITALLLAVLMLTALCACTGDDDVAGKTETGTPTAAPSEELDLGTVSGGKYENSYFGFGCEFDSEWTYADEETLLSMVQNTADIVEDEDMRENILSADVFYDMIAYYSDGATNVNVVVQNIGVIYGAVIDEKSIVEETIKVLPEQYAAASMDVQSCETDTADFAGAERQAIRTHSIVNGSDLYQLQVYVKNGSYLGIVTLSSPLEENISAMLTYFYAV